MFGLGLPELVIVFSVALLVLGPRRLPELAKSMGGSIRGFREAVEGKSGDKSPSPTLPAAEAFETAQGSNERRGKSSPSFSSPPLG